MLERGTRPTLTRPKASVSSAIVRSVEPSLTTTISYSTNCEVSSERSEATIERSSLKAGTRIETGMLISDSATAW